MTSTICKEGRKISRSNEMDTKKIMVGWDKNRFNYYEIIASSKLLN
jgi:hypothetical protein